MTAPRTKLTLTIHDLATLRRLVDDEVTNLHDQAGYDPETGQSHLEDDDEDLVYLQGLDRKLHKAVQRCHNQPEEERDHGNH